METKRPGHLANGKLQVATLDLSQFLIEIQVFDAVKWMESRQLLNDVHEGTLYVVYVRGLYGCFVLGGIKA